MENPYYISHVFFADDSLIFARANHEGAEGILSVLSRYRKASRQMVNLDKSQVSFSKNMGIEGCEMVQQVFDMVSIVNHSTYLGLPMILRKSKKEIFGLVVD